MAVKNVLFKIQAETAGLRKELEAVKAQIAGVGKATDDTTKKVTLLQRTLAGAAAAFGGVQVAAAALDFGKGAIKAVADYESLQISFETFLGSADKAKQVLADLEQFSIATPFTPEQVNNAGKALLAFGEPVDQLQDKLRQIGDVSSATGKDFNELAVIYGKARVAGTLYAEDINQLTEAGVPIIQEFAKELGVSENQVKKLGSEGKISFNVFEKSFANLTTEGGRFFGLTDKLSQSTAGRISTLEGNFEQLKRSIGEGLLPVFEFLLNAALKTIDVFAALPGFFKENARSILFLSGIVAFYVGQKKAELQAELISNAQKLISAVRDRAAAVATGLRTAATRAAAVAMNLFTGATTASAVATRAATAATTGFNTALKSNPIGLIVSILTTALALFSDYIFAADDAALSTQHLTIEQQALASFTEIMNRQVAEEKQELDNLFGALRNTNKGSKERSELISEINSKYGTTLKNLSDEKLFVEQLDKAYQDLIVQIKQKAALEAKQKVLTDVIAKEVRAQQFLENSLGKFASAFTADVFGGIGRSSNEALNKLYDNLDATTKARVDEAIKKSAAAKNKIQTEFADAPALNRPSEEFIQQQGELAAGGIGDATNPFLQLSKDEEEAMKKRSEELGYQIDAFDFFLEQYSEASAAIAALDSKYFKELSNIGTGSARVGSETQKQAEKLAEDRKKLFLDLLREIEKLNLELEKQPASFITPKTKEEEISKLRELLAARKKEIDSDLDNRVKDAKAAGTLTTEIEKQFDEIRKKQKEIATNETENAITNIERKAALDRAKTLNDINNTNNAITLENMVQNTKELEKERSKMLKELAVAKTPEARTALKEQLDENLLEIEASLEDEKRVRIAAIEEQRDFDLQQEGLTAEEKKLIQKNAELEILKTQQDFADRSIAIAEDEADRKKKIKEDEKAAIINGIEQVGRETLNAINAVIAARIQETESAISGQQKRVDAAKEIAEKGNAELLQIEEERLRKLNEQKARFVRQQQALAAIELVANSSVAIAKAAAEGGAAAPFTIAATLIALAAGLVQARAQARAAASFAKGGYTGDGGKYDEAGVVHKGEFVITKEKTRQFRPLLEAIHAGRDPKLASNLNQKIIVINNSTTDARLDRIEKAIREQKGLTLSIDERGINGIVSRLQYKDQRIRNKAK